jgi:translation initiation factor IF-2
MRVSEIAKELGVSNKEILEALEKFGAYMKTASSGVTKEQETHLRQAFSKAEPAPEPEPVPAVPETAPVVEAETPAGEDPAASSTILLRGPVVLKDFAALIGVRPNKLITDLMAKNIFANMNYAIDVKTALELGRKHGADVALEEKPKPPPPPPPPPPSPAAAPTPTAPTGGPSAPAAPAAPRKPKPPKKRKVIEEEEEPQPQMKQRPPVVTILGHVDHGKTSLLDRIRGASVAAGEAGGITQHIGAYTVRTATGKEITFLDTPGHEAFTKMRARGANLTDIAVIVVSAEDGIMPQTKEAIQHARAAQVVIMVAINKIDLPSANVDRVKQQLQNEGLQPEDWGGEVICCPVSAKTGAGIPELLDMILLQTEVMELTAESGSPARGFVIEAQREPGMGPTASVLVKTGTLRAGDTVLCGPYVGRVKALLDDAGRKVPLAEASHAVKLLGLPEVPEAGAALTVYPSEKEARAISARMLEEIRHQTLTGNAVKRATLDSFFATSGPERKTLNLVLKADVQGSLEAILQSLGNIKSDKVSLKFILTGVGNISENDVLLGGASGAILIGFHVGLDTAAEKSAKREGVEVRQYEIIYELIDDVRKAMAGLLSPVQREKIIGHAEVRQIFKLNKAGNVAGSMVRDGRVGRRGQARLLRGREVVWSGRIGSLRRFQSDASEVREGQECGIQLENFNDVNVGDVIEYFEIESILPEL